MELNIIIGGQAGQGVAKISEVLGKAFVKAGYYVFNYRDYQSLIRGGHNYNGIKVSDRWVGSHEEDDVDILIALDDNTVNIHKDKLRPGGTLISDKNFGLKGIKEIVVDVNTILKETGAPSLSKNVVLISVLWKSLNLPKEILKEVISKELKGEYNVKIVDKVFEKNFEKIEDLKLREVKNDRLFLSGSEGIALGAIAAGIDLYIAYPMTPASPVLHILAKLKDKYNIRVYQPENEIAVVNMALGASYAGAKVMVGTSGGGFALMNEAISLQGMSEIPLVVYLAMRYAPATGIPTYTSQGDMLYSIFAGHGEFPKVVVAPGDSMEAFTRTIEAFYLAYKYNVLSIILSDKHLAESHYTFDNYPRVHGFIKAERFLNLKPTKDYKQYEITENGVTRRTVPGIEDDIMVKANSYEHDEYGITTEDPEWAVKMTNKRLRKLKYIYNEIMMLDPYTLYNPEGKKLIVSWGSTKGAILDFIAKSNDFAFLKINYLSPFPKDVMEIIEKYDEVILVENNATGQLGKLIRMETGIEIENKILKYDARPFTSKYLAYVIKRKRFILE